MLNLNEIKEIINLLNESSIQEFKLKQGVTEIELKKTSGVVTQPVVASQPTTIASEAFLTTAPQQAASTLPEATVQTSTAVTSNKDTIEIVSPMVGTFYASPNPDSPSFVNKGDVVSNDTVVCMIEAMKLFNEIEAEVNGEIVEALVQNGQLVEYGQPLFLVRPTGGK